MAVAAADGWSESALAQLLNGSAFHHLVPIELVSVDAAAQRLVLRLPYRASYEGPPGTRRTHGGVIATLADVAGAFCAMAVLGRDAPTLSLQVDYHRPAFDRDLIATATLRHAGRTSCTVQIDIADAEGRGIATGRAILVPGTAS